MADPSLVAGVLRALKVHADSEQDANWLSELRSTLPGISIGNTDSGLDYFFSNDSPPPLTCHLRENLTGYFVPRRVDVGSGLLRIFTVMSLVGGGSVAGVLGIGETGWGPIGTNRDQ